MSFPHLEARPGLLRNVDAVTRVAQDTRCVIAAFKHVWSADLLAPLRPSSDKALADSWFYPPVGAYFSPSWVSQRR